METSINMKLLLVGAAGKKCVNHEHLKLQDGADDSGNWQWCLLTIAGNKTIVQRRRKDFIHYLRMNVAR